MNKEKSIALIIIFLLLGAIVVGVFHNPQKIQRKTFSPSYYVKKRGNLAIVWIYGPIEVANRSSFQLFPRGSDYIVNELRSLSKISTLQAVILRINSPGGTVGAVQEIYEEIENLRKRGIKVVASFGDIATSGAYYIASACDAIVSQPGTMTGSIGVIIPILNFKNLMEKVGIKQESIKSGRYKDIGAGSKEMTPEEREILQKIVDNVYNQFLSAVKKGRKGKVKGEWNKIADGRIFSGEQAYKLGLVDELGGLEKAKEVAKKLAGIKRLIIIKERKGWRRFFDIEDKALFNLRYYFGKDIVPYYLPPLR